MGNEKQYAELAAILAGAEHMVFLGGAGVSTGSGIPDFRSVDGLYHQKFDYPPGCTRHRRRRKNRRSGC